MAGKAIKLTAISAAALFAVSVNIPVTADENDHADYYEYNNDYSYDNDYNNYDQTDYGYSGYNDYDQTDYGYSGYTDESDAQEESSGWDYTIDDDEDEESSDDEETSAYDDELDEFDVDENSRQRAELERENSELAEKLQITKEELEKKKKYSKELQEKISDLGKEIKDRTVRIDDLNRLIKEKQEIIDAKKAEIENILALLRTRLRAIHKAGSASSLEIILGAKSFEDFLDKAEMVKSMSDRDSRMINSVREQMKIVSDEQKVLQDSKKELEIQRSALEKNKQEINGLFEENTKLIKELTTESEELKNEQDENKARQKELKKALAAYKKRLAEKQNIEMVVGPDPDGGFVWPCPGFTYLTSTFDEWRGVNNHGALDIAEGGIYGAKVMACYDGVVFSTFDGCEHDYGKSASCGCGGGYGNYVMIDHGNGKISIYGHLSGVTVSIGQTVSAGQLIGYVGSTGFSTGAHLHFETRYNGVKYDPLTEY